MMQSAVQCYFAYLKRQDQDLKDWALIQDYSMKEQAIRFDYLAGVSDIKPLRGTGVQRPELDEGLQVGQRRFATLVRAHYLIRAKPSAERFLDFFDELLAIREELV